jgi:hypothetical protein
MNYCINDYAGCTRCETSRLSVRAESAVRIAPRPLHKTIKLLAPCNERTAYYRREFADGIEVIRSLKLPPRNTPSVTRIQRYH